MTKTSICTRTAGALVAALALGGASYAANEKDAPKTAVTAQHKAAAGSKLDLTGKKRVGKASYYSGKFAGRKMADGTPMNPHHDNAASKTLPIGTVAKVTNLETGQSAVVTIKDRGPYVKDRIVDLSPATAQQVGITHKGGVADVAVTPIKVPQPDGSQKVGEAAEVR